MLAKGGRFLEAPVSGSKGPAAAGALVFLCGGDKALFEQVSAELEPYNVMLHPHPHPNPFLDPNPSPNPNPNPYQVSAELEAMGKANFYYGEVGAGTTNPNPTPNHGSVYYGSTYHGSTFYGSTY